MKQWMALFLCFFTCVTYANMLKGFESASRRQGSNNQSLQRVNEDCENRSQHPCRFKDEEHKWPYQPFFYTGASVAFWHVHWAEQDNIDGGDVFAQKFPAAQVMFGFAYNPYIRTEISLGQSLSEDKRNIRGTTQHSHLKLQTLAFDLLGYYPIDVAETFWLIGDFGIQRLKADMDANFSAIGFTTYPGAHHEDRPRLGMGAAWDFHPHMSLRLLTQLQESKLEGLAHDFNMYQIGMLYRF